MRRLVLVRHAKSAWDDPSLDDHDRPLAPRGRAALPKMRAHVNRLELPALRVVCSTAVRAQSTYHGFADVLADRADVVVDPVVYDADGARLHRLVRVAGDQYRSLMLVGHNPALHDLALLLVGDGDPAERLQLDTKLPTGAVVELAVGGTWSDLTDGAAILRSLFFPRRPRP